VGNTLDEWIGPYTALSPAQRARLYTSLDGLSIGDAFGDRIFFEFRTFHAEVFELPLAQRPLPAGRWNYTDDTQMALSIVDVLTHYGSIDQDALARSFGERFERGRGYGAQCTSCYRNCVPVTPGTPQPPRSLAVKGRLATARPCGSPRWAPALPTTSASWWSALPARLKSPTRIPRPSRAP